MHERLNANALTALRRRQMRRHAVLVNVMRICLLALLLGSWQVLSGKPGHGLAIIDEFNVSKPSQIYDAIKYWVDNDQLWPNIGTTFEESLLGFVVGSVAGVLVGFLVGISTTFGEVVTPFLTALYSVPRLAIAPLFMLWFGLGIESKVLFVGLLVFFLVFYNTLSGVREVDDDLIDVLQIIRPGRWHVYRYVVLPSAMTWILGGLRVSAPYALVGAVTSEIISSNRGMGYLLISSSGQLDTAGVFAAILVMMVMALAISGLVYAMDRYFLRWKR